MPVKDFGGSATKLFKIFCIASRPVSNDQTHPFQEKIDPWPEEGLEHLAVEAREPFDKVAFRKNDLGIGVRVDEFHRPEAGQICHRIVHPKELVPVSSSKHFGAGDWPLKFTSGQVAMAAFSKKA
ncbi:uncharacterized protein ColSpa_07717 [Colletotrichum spaethianum]|uniref:Uncharacterized protein n=1 Tax=Colletotrichum spaethianum TaxID=700344 RepID=A0AA37UJ75_9PEZI|nr:uncharacterized protein ColSpa_07717 [Colletotrichum spaethianum]GKT47536.1 hypothetical protein ColSpa_07717 [Colletotrichum spaethianum]